MIDASGIRPQRWAGKRIHFVGIGGVGMGALARILAASGARVTGSDQRPLGADLAADGIRAAVGHAPENVPLACDLVVATAAVPPTNPEVAAASARGVEVWKYARLLGEVSGERQCVAVSGVHGKTTTTSMVAYALQETGLDPSVVVGGCVGQLGGSSRLGEGPHFVVEACEYDRSFWSLRPRCAVINNIEPEHMDYYRDLDDLVAAFAGLAERVREDGVLFVNGDDPNALRAARSARCRVETFGVAAHCHWRGGFAGCSKGLNAFTVSQGGRDLGEFGIRLAGAHNVRNALACIAVCVTAGAPVESLRRAMPSFLGVDRRLQEIGVPRGVRVVDDYAHHPTEIRATLAAAREAHPEARLWCVFQPHQCSRTRLLLDEFADSFAEADRVSVLDIYSVRDSEDDRRMIHARDLVERIRQSGTRADYEPSFEAATARLALEARAEHLVLTMGAGPVDQVARSLVKELEREANVAAA